ncbi:MAG: SIMPL domain-containing protein [Patescibacteria group bacterium]
MDRDVKNYHGFWLKESKAFLFFLFMIAVFWYVSAYSRSVVPERSFTVSGEGEIVAVPDVAEINFGVLTEGGKNLTDLQKENAEKINKAVSFLKEEGIDEKDIKTQFYNISPRYQSIPCPLVIFDGFSRPCPPSSEVIGYTISQNLSVKVRDLNKGGDILAGVVERGANNVSGPNFMVDDPVKFQNEAREKAIKQAREKAKSMAKASGFRVGRLISIQESFYGPPIIYGLEAKGSTGPSIEPGSQEIISNVTLIYEIR